MKIVLIVLIAWLVVSIIALAWFVQQALTAPEGYEDDEHGYQPGKRKPK
jgi:hypothetical protein